MRWCLLIAMVVLSFAAPAHAAPRALTRVSGAVFAPAGEQVLVARRHGANLRVVAIPVTGGAPRRVLSFDAPKGWELYAVRLAASPQRAALAIIMDKPLRDTVGSLAAVQVFAGPAGGGWSDVQPFAEVGDTPDPAFPQVDGERSFSLEE